MLAEPLEPLLALDALAERELPGAHPHLRLARAVVARRHDARREISTSSAADPPQVTTVESDRVLPFRLPGGEQLALVGFDVGDDCARAVHLGFAAVGADARKRRTGVTAATRRDRLLDLVEDIDGELIEHVGALQLNRTVRHQRAQGLDLARQLAARKDARLEA